LARSERNIVWRGAVRSDSSAVGALGAIELADGFRTNKPGPDGLRFRVLLRAAFQLECLLAAAKRALYFDVSTFRERRGEISELAENQDSMPLSVRLPLPMGLNDLSLMAVSS